MSLTSNRFFHLSFFCALGAFSSLPAHAGLEINPYPNQPAPISASKAEPIDLIEVAPADQALEQEFKELDALVEAMSAAEKVDAEVASVPEIVEAAPAPVIETAPVETIPLLRMDDLQRDNPQSGLYVPRKVVRKAEPVAPIVVSEDVPPVVPMTVSDEEVQAVVDDIEADLAPSKEMAKVEPSGVAPSRPLFASTRSWFEGVLSSDDAVPPAVTAEPIAITAPPPPVQGVISAPASEQLLAEPATFVPVIEQQSKEPEVRGEKWNSFAGANVRETLDVWSKDAGVELIWADYDTEFDVRDTLTLETTYEAAVQALLEQYDDARIRPVGSLHVDPDSGVRTLLIQILDES